MGLLILGSSYNLPAHWEGGARARFQNNAAKNPVRPRKNTAEGGCGGNSAVFLQKIEASPAALLIESRTQQKSFLFLLEEKIRSAQNQKRRENFFAGWRVVASGGGAASFVGGLPEMGSDFVQGMEPNWMIRVHRLGASPLGGQIGENFPRLFGFKANRLRAQKVAIEPKKSWQILYNLPAEARSAEAINSQHTILKLFCQT